jgi:transposase InsO family protein
MIDIATRWIEIVALPNKTSETVALAFDRTWLARYPRPFEVLHDNGGEFIGNEFQELLTSYGIHDYPTTIKNPTANSILERAHQVISNSFRLMEVENLPFDEVNPFDGIIANTAFALRATIHSTLQASPAQLCFGRDMIMHTQFVANWHLIRSRQQQRMLKDNIRENKTRIEHQYAVGDLILIKNDDIKSKLSKPTYGPFPITQLHLNKSIVTIDRHGYVETISIRRLIPYRPMA